MIHLPPGATPASNACPNITGNGKVVKLPEGTCQGDLIITGNANQVIGVGPGKSVVNGNLNLSGNQNQLHGVSVRGNSNISGNENDATGNELSGRVVVTGTGNKR